MRPKFAVFVLFLGATLLSACASSRTDLNPEDGIYDPFEASNRHVHSFNRGLDRIFVRPAAQGYTNVLPDQIEENIGNLADTLGQPSDMVNGILQGDLRSAGTSGGRFLVNATFGVFGLFDIATGFGIPDQDNDFGKTLHAWGAGEGPFISLPFLGPSTQRDATGRVVDLFTNPLSYILESPESYYGPIASAGDGLGTRGRFTDTIDSILYNSADSYAQSRLIYMQNRRFELGGDDASSEIDPFELDTSGF